MYDKNKKHYNKGWDEGWDDGFDVAFEQIKKYIEELKKCKK